LVFRAYELWRELERTVGSRLLYITGSIDAGHPNGMVVGGSLQACTDYGLEHELLTSSELTRRFPAYRLPSGMVGNYQPEGGYLVPEQCVISHVIGAQRLGAEIHGRERVREWNVHAGHVRVVTDRAKYDAGRLVVTAGPWSAEQVSSLEGLVQIERQVVGWFQPQQPDLFSPERFPVFVLDDSNAIYYGFPIAGIPGVKVGKFGHLGEKTDPDLLDREVHQRDELALRDCLENYFPDGNGPVLSMQACMFSNSPDQHFIIGSPDSQSEVVFAAGFSGHGFKFCSVVGEILADLAITGKTRHGLSLFAPDRFGANRVSGHSQSKRATLRD
jgi:sarcosine oxidase